MGKITMIGACDEDNGIGKNGEIPWYSSEDMRHFRRTTEGQVVVMGRKTFDGLGPLPGRINIVLSKNLPEGGLPDSTYVENFVEQVLEHARDSVRNYYIIGGQQIYEQFLPHADNVILTRIPGRHECDTFFPELNDDWTLTDSLQGTDMTIQYYKRK